MRAIELDSLRMTLSEIRGSGPKKMNYHMRALIPILVAVTLVGCATTQHGHDHTYEPVAAAGDHHVPIIENDRVRVLRVVIEPGETVPYHQHTMQSVFVTLEPATLVFKDLDGNELRRVEASAFQGLPRVEWRNAAPAPRSVQNVGTTTLRALRIEFK